MKKIMPWLIAFVVLCGASQVEAKSMWSKIRHATTRVREVIVTQPVKATVNKVEQICAIPKKMDSTMDSGKGALDQASASLKDVASHSDTALDTSAKTASQVQAAVRKLVLPLQIALWGLVGLVSLLGVKTLCSLRSRSA